MGENLSAPDRFHMFCIFFEDYLSTAALCPLNEQFITTQNLFDEEMDPTKDTTLRKKIDEYDLIGDGEIEKYQEIKSLLNRYISHKHHISKALINQIKEITKNVRYQNISEIDYGLIVLSLIKYGGQKKTIITNDTLLYRLIENVELMINITLNKVEYSTEDIISLTMLTYCYDVYECCKYENEQFWALYLIVDSYVYEGEYDGDSIQRDSIIELTSYMHKIEKVYH